MSVTSRLDFVSLFSGCGGFDLGLTSTGFTPRGAFDVDRTALANYRRNIQNTFAWQADISNGIPNESQLRNVSAVIAGPPYQGFSTAGRRHLDDARNDLLPLSSRLALRLNSQLVV